MYEPWESLFSGDTRNLAAEESKMRLYLSRTFSAELERRDISTHTFQQMSDISESQVERLLNKDAGPLMLLTIIKAANALDLGINFHILPRLYRSEPIQI
jgi:hypothetical protein